MITRAQYLSDTKLHHTFYLEVAADAGIDYARSGLLPKIKAALAAGDEHLNTIPLSVWDMASAMRRHQITSALKARGDFYSMAGGVCTHKAAAKHAATLNT